MYRQMATMAGQHDLSSLKHPVSAGEALPDATRQLWKQATGIEMTDGIGGTEVIHIYISSAGQQVRAGSIGQVVPGYVAQIVDDDMQPVLPGVVGRLAVRGPTGCKYLADPRQQDYVKNGWNLPGDTFVMDADGYFSYQARNDDMIISAGYNIAGPEVEGALLQHPAVAAWSACPTKTVATSCRPMWCSSPATRAMPPWKRPCKSTSNKPSPRSSTHAKWCSWTCCRAPKPASCSASSCVKFQSTNNFVGLIFSPVPI
jgi:acyl-CoA synthetase (AMP-forming)/AMP-acid ligase II